MIIIVNNMNMIFRITNLSHIYENEFTNLYGIIKKIKIINYSGSLTYFIQHIPSNVTELTIKNCSLEYFPEINPEHCVNKIDLSLNRIVNLPDLSDYIHLKNLNLHSNSITSFFSFPPNIERLDISNNKIVSIENYPSTLNYFNFSCNLILFRPIFLNQEHNVEMIYHNNIFNIIPNNYEESAEPLLFNQNILFSDNINNQNTAQNEIPPFPFTFTIDYQILENNDEFSEINLDDIDNEEITINNPYQEITQKINSYIFESEELNVKIPNEFFCPISKEIMLEPVVIRDGYTYEKKSILEWFKISNKSPVTSKELRNKMYLNNTSLRNMIREWIDENKDNLC